MIRFEKTAAGHLKFSADACARGELAAILADPERGYPAALNHLALAVKPQGLEFLTPDDIGALTDAPIFGEKVTRNARGQVIATGDVWWFPDYAVKDEMDILARTGEVTFTRAPNATDENTPSP